MWFRYEKDGKDVVQDLNLEVKQGEFYALVGGNIGYDILKKAFKGILNKQVFDENFLMAVAQ